MDVLKNKIDFAVILFVKNANPNGDPLNGNRPRVNYDGYGEVSDVCIKRKIRNRLMEAGYSILIQSNDNRNDDHKSIRSRAESELKKFKEEMEKREAACKKWIDVRSFGQVFAFKGEKTKKKGSKDDEQNDENEAELAVSIGIRGPVSIHSAFSVMPILDKISTIQITKSVNNEDGPTKSSDTMGMKHRVDHGAYVFYGSINPQLAAKTGFSSSDADAIKQALIKLFQNDASSARPEGSMQVIKVYWWKHNSPNGQYSSALVHKSLKITPKVDSPKEIEDYEITLNPLSGLTPEILDGL